MICKYEHDGDCCNSGATQYMCKCKRPCNTVEPLTNAERIRRMSDTELAKALIRYRGEYRYFECPDGRCFSTRLTAISHTEDWLHEPAKEE